MIAIDYRNLTWDLLQSSVQGKRLAVLSAWKQHGPCTTRELAERAGMDLLGVRPRTTELLQLGLLVEVQPDDGTGASAAPCETAGVREGVYRAFSDDEALEEFRRRVADAQKEAQLGLGI